MKVRAVTAASGHPVAVEATGEVAGGLLDGGAAGAGLLLVVAGAAFRGALEDVCGALVRLVSPGRCAAVAAGTVVGGGAAFDRAGLAAVALHGGRWSARALGAGERVAPAPAGTASVLLSTGEPDGPGGPRELRLVPSDLVPGGGAPSPARSAVAPGTFWLDGSRADHGMVLVGDAHGVTVVDLAPWTPLGPPRAVVSADTTVLRSIEGRPAAEVLVEAIGAVGPAPAAGLLEMGLRRDDGTVVGITREPAGPWARTSVPLVVGERVEVVARRVADAVAGVSALRRGPAPAAMLLASSELHAGSPGVVTGPGRSLRLGPALAEAGGGVMVGLGVEPAAGRPRTELMVIT